MKKIVSSNNKKIVHYIPNKEDHIVIGATAYIFPVDHPSIMVSNEQIAATSTVLKYNKNTGVFETRNTIYKPLSKDIQ